MPYRPPVGLPYHEQRQRWQGWLASLLAHLLLILMAILPSLWFVRLPMATGAGGAGPAGGGGGKPRGGDGGGPRIQYVRIAPAPAQSATAKTAPTPVVTPPPPPPPVKPVTPTPAPVQPPPAQPATVPPSANAAGQGTGEGTAGSGTGTGGAGPGRGGGVGSGEGTGRGSSVGPGTGGGPGTVHPPTPTQFFLPPLPAPAKVRGFRMIAWFDVDSVGKATLLRFTPTPDGKYNDRLGETLRAIKFRPAVRAVDGVPVRDTVDIQYQF